jgi:hypothetical protein
MFWPAGTTTFTVSGPGFLVSRIIVSGSFFDVKRLNHAGAAFRGVSSHVSSPALQSWAAFSKGKCYDGVNRDTDKE